MHRIPEGGGNQMEPTRLGHFDVPGTVLRKAPPGIDRFPGLSEVQQWMWNTLVDDLQLKRLGDDCQRPVAPITEWTAINIASSLSGGILHRQCDGSGIQASLETVRCDKDAWDEIGFGESGIHLCFTWMDHVAPDRATTSRIEGTLLQDTRQNMDTSLITHLADYGPMLVFVLLLLSGIGIPVGEDIVNIPAGFLVGNGTFPGLPTFLAAYFGVLFGDCMWFFVCRRFGTPLLHKNWFKRIAHPRRLLEVKHQFEHKGLWVLVIARFIPGGRTPVITMAGLMHMRWRDFLLAEAPSVAITAPLQVGLGYLIGRGLSDSNTAEMVLSIVGLIFVIFALSLGLSWWLQSRRKKQVPPRAEAAWLRRFRKKRGTSPPGGTSKPSN